MRFLPLLLIGCLAAAGEAAWRDFIEPPATLAELVRQIDRDLGDDAAAAVATVFEPAQRDRRGYYVIYLAHRFAWLERGHLAGLLLNCAVGGDPSWIRSDPVVSLLFAYASVKGGKPIDGTTFRPDQRYVPPPPPAGPPIDPAQLDIVPASPQPPPP